MTNDAKIGLLLGLALIVAIVFAVSGPSKFLKLSKVEQPSPKTSAPAMEPGKDLIAIARNTARTLNKSHQTAVPQDIVSPYSETIANNTPSVKIAARQVAAKNSNDNSQIKTYIIQPDDNLASVAKKFYGQEEGNRLVNIQKIAEFNKLKSADFIYLGQKLKIPPLEQTVRTEFVAVKNFNSNPAKVRNVINLPAVSAAARTMPVSKYVVGEDDTLWSIASRMLGSGSRYVEILRLNKHLANANNIQPGMVIKLPNR